MLSNPDAAVVTKLIDVLSVLAGVWFGYYLSRRAGEKDRRDEKTFTIYQEVERLANLLTAFQKKMIEGAEFGRQWHTTTENIMVALIGSGADRKKVLNAINVRWDDPKGVAEVRALADDLLEQLDPKYLRASRELCEELGIKREDIDTIIVPRRPRSNS